MLILLPPSETKRADGDGAPYDPAALSFPELTRVRRRTVSAVVKLGRTPRTARRVLELGPEGDDEIRRNAELRTSPTMPALDRYTGVLYDALDAPSLDAVQRARAAEHVAVGSALFGLVRADDPIPAYRLSGGSRLPALGSLTKLWKPEVTPLLERAADDGPVVDLRSGAYRTLAPLARAVTVRVLTERADGARSVVSHFNKSTKGRVARELVTATAWHDVDDVASVLVAAGMRVEQPGALELDVITAG